jgi:hypothetical protein
MRRHCVVCVVSEAQATALRFDGRWGWVSASEGGPWVVQRAVALVVVLPAHPSRHLVYCALVFDLGSISSSVVSLLV